MPISARPVASLGPTGFSSVTCRSARSCSVMPPGTAVGPALLDADEVGVQRLTPFVDLELDVRVRPLDVLLDARGVGETRVGAGDQGDQLRFVVDQRIDEGDHGVD